MNAVFPARQLSDIATSIDYGVTASASTVENGTKFLRITDIQDGTVDWQSVPFCEAPPNKLRSALLLDGDIVFARTGATTGKSFLIRSPPDGAVFASYLIRVRPSVSVNPAYLAHFFQSKGYWSQIQRKTQGAAQGGVNATSLSEIEIPLPPLDEQRRIAAILDKADALRRKRRRAIDLINSLTESIFLEMFGAKAGGRIPSVALREVCQKITDGTHQSPKWAEEGVPFLFVSNIRGQKITFDTKNFVSETEYEKLTKHSPIEPGDVLYTAVGSYGNAAVVPSGGKFVFQRHIAHLKPKLDRVNSQYLSIALEMPDAKAQADKEARGIAQKTVTLASLKGMTIPLPPIAIQNKFAEKISLIHGQLDLAAKGLFENDVLFSSLQHCAFSGQL